MYSSTSANMDMLIHSPRFPSLFYFDSVHVLLLLFDCFIGDSAERMNWYLAYKSKQLSDLNDARCKLTKEMNGDCGNHIYHRKFFLGNLCELLEIGFHVYFMVQHKHMCVTLPSGLPLHVYLYILSTSVHKVCSGIFLSYKQRFLSERTKHTTEYFVYKHT